MEIGMIRKIKDCRSLKTKPVTEVKIRETFFYANELFIKMDDKSIYSLSTCCSTVLVKDTIVDMVDIKIDIINIP